MIVAHRVQATPLTLERFLAERRAGWDELDALVTEARGSAERLGPERIRRLGALYRSAAADLALARRRFASDTSRARLEDLVGRARLLVYDAPSDRRSLRAFASRGYWRRIRERPVALVVAALLLFAPAVPASIWGYADPGAAVGLAPDAESMTEPQPRGTDQGLSGPEEAAFSSFVLTNNIRVTFVAFAGGITLGLLTVFVLVFNGLSLGVAGGMAVGAGNGSYFVALVAAHGILELSCIVIGGAAGLRLGWAVIEPGRRRRVDALVAEGRKTVELVLGTAVWLVLAGVIEGFVSRGGLGATPTLIVGLAVGGVFWGLVVWRGGPAPEGYEDEEPEDDDAPLARPGGLIPARAPSP